ncbi:hypothetical protein B484DRAFT_458792 [Ochromonadaceae sp. CCMP2298]|nr:hypothetical protein B484DRAFT_458792 [Ochromonadaceae sp. CCMP2298]|mmetsp:Transcript_34891/g.76942  ORF Transcript_34891/g.76942 Transcript_34891/m.76942 type:complete len:353 (+) Transcript_34891:106-1164(+)|eukprot:CAMPEP_0173187940 /NCGR_PEP_ID=MMETSP1141-20130122/10991_1 /TAXON_ID=483371 /ORGANISM="non described non described, Strain CCMP2298" /LENGTH=352 /DNA_ID=CAMNT_0014111839 /DNA_START=56 /DNA_END=1114 /DNA_ORIENTATION=+
MARANLNIETQINEEFLRVQETRDVRIVKVKIEDERLILDGLISKVGSAREDFDSVLLDALDDAQASFALFNLTDDTGTVFTTALSWLLVAWVPDGCRVRDKMLYSSSREDLKRSLGLGYFTSEYAANTRGDLTWKQFQDSLRVGDDDVLTEAERLVIDEKQQVQAESANTKSNALGVMPFNLSEEVLGQLEAFVAGDCNWVEMTVVQEVVELVCFRTVRGELLQPYIDTETAAFIALRLPVTPVTSVTDSASTPPTLSLFLFSCPENTPVRLKMTMSSCKAAVLAAAQSKGVTFDKSIEIRDAADVDEAVQAEIAPSPVTLSASASAAVSHSKPQRPGRGKARVGKFVADS